MKIIVTGGGTGGHIYPAIAIAKGILARWPDSQVLYVGTQEGMESKLVPASGLTFQKVSARGWQGRKPDQLIKALKAINKGKKEAQSIIEDFKPEAVIGTGGYACLPIAQAAVHSKIPVFIHEQNAYPGLTNRLISIWAKKVMITFAEAGAHFPKSARSKLVLTGLPVRSEIQSMTRAGACDRLGLDPQKLTLLSIGGSRGAQSINNAMLHVIKELYGSEKVQIIHACGSRDYDRMCQNLQESGIDCDGQSNIILKPYIDEMQYALGAADICVGRAGAAFIAEITVCGIPAILIPYPYASGDHQTHNAKSLVNQNAAIMIEDKELTGPHLLGQIGQLLNDEALRKQMKENSITAGRPEALGVILDVLEQSL
jgi:UDP-N-acetylglucosamine--N-acetylmuramyl-(pentapeptide) pyrophosphoryl-undecaprenol N-acetylglucosamine transferase